METDFSLDFLDGLNDNDPIKVANAFKKLENAKFPLTIVDTNFLFEKILINHLEALNLYVVRNLPLPLVDLAFLLDFNNFSIPQLRIIQIWAYNKAVFIFPRDFTFPESNHSVMNLGFEFIESLLDEKVNGDIDILKGEYED